MAWSNKNSVDRLKTHERAVRGENMDALLFDLLSHKTPHGDEKNIYALLPKKGHIDVKGNVIYNRGSRKDHKIMFSCHLDTVHRTAGTILPVIDKDWYVWAAEETGVPSILGADDKVGVYIMCKLMEADVPGVYVFHVGEERGGIGSSHIVQHSPSVANDLSMCVAFDRKGYGNIITQQRGVCCSGEFATALSAQLNDALRPKVKSPIFNPDSSGVFTDSANYTHLIPECTNLSVGYFDQHSTSERFDLIWLEDWLIPALKRVKWAELPVVRKPVPKTTHTNNYSGRTYSPPTKTTTPVNTSSAKAEAIRKMREIKEDSKWSDIPFFDLVTDNLSDQLTEAQFTTLLKACMNQESARPFLIRQIIRLATEHRKTSDDLLNTGLELEEVRKDNEELEGKMKLLEQFYPH